MRGERAWRSGGGSASGRLMRRAKRWKGRRRSPTRRGEGRRAALAAAYDDRRRFVRFRQCCQMGVELLTALRERRTPADRMSLSGLLDAGTIVIIKRADCLRYHSADSERTYFGVYSIWLDETSCPLFRLMVAELVDSRRASGPTV